MDAILAVNDFSDVPSGYRDHEHTVSHTDRPDERFVIVRDVTGAAELKSRNGVRVFHGDLLDPDKATDIHADGVEVTAGVHDASNLDHIDLD